jgi:hypothetical protein
MVNELKTGLINAADGTQIVSRGDRTGAQVTAMAHGSYAEPSRQGALMLACTAAAGIAPGTVLSTTPPLTIWNPPSSNKLLHVMKASVGYVSGTLGAGTICYAALAGQTTIPSTGTELTPLCANIGYPRGVGRAFSGSTLVAIPTLAYPGPIMGAFLATTALQPIETLHLVDGAVTIPPGSCFCMQAIAGAGTSPLVIFGIEWEEVNL